MKILQVISSLDPKVGGPASAAQLFAEEASIIGHEVSLCCLDDLGKPWINNTKFDIVALGRGFLGYRLNTRLDSWLKKNSSNFDVIIVHGLWQYHGFSVRRAAKKNNIPYFVFPHGMLDPWFKQQYPLKHLKKIIYWLLVERKNLKNAKVVLFTAEEERRLAKESFCFYSCREVVVNYSAPRPPKGKEELNSLFFKSNPQFLNKRIILFLGRIHEKKGCDILLESFSRVAHLDDKLVLLYAGPNSHGLMEKLFFRASELKIKEKVHWLGMLDGEDKWAALASAEVFTLPSHQENFGIAIAESLACSIPVIITDKVNIYSEIKKAEAGLVSSDNEKDFTLALSRWLGLSEEERMRCGRNAERLYEEEFSPEKSAKSILEVLADRNKFPDHL
jgi:glycosyltransferase involved in cell wall biosynthesis